MREWIIFLLLIVTNCGYSQNGNPSLDWKHESELAVGDTMPNIPLGEIYNNHTGKTNFSQFRGKLLILDFWNTNCLSCMILFPHMENLQKEFDDKIQIIIVDTQETQEQISNKFKLPNYKQFRLPDLPSIVDAKHLRKLFLTQQGVPHHVWIDENGVVRIRGGALNTYPEKIKSLLSHQSILNTNDMNTSVLFKKNSPYYSLSTLFKPSYLSSFTAYNNDYAASTGDKIEALIDSNSRTVRSTYINREILDLYTTAYENILKNDISNLVFSKNCYENHSLDFFSFLVKDTTKYTFEFIRMDNKSKYGANNNDSNYIKSKFCYEQIIPIGKNENEFKEIMLENLNQYFGYLYNLKVSVEERIIPCYLVVNKLKNIKHISTPGKLDSVFYVKGVKMIRHYNSNLKYTIRWALLDTFYKVTGNQKMFIFDETGIKDDIDFDLTDSASIHSIEDLRKSLQINGLDIIKGNKKIKYIVFRD